MKTTARCCGWSRHPGKTSFNRKKLVLRFLQKGEIMGALQQSPVEAGASATLTKAVVRAAGFLGLSQATLAQVLGVSGATASRLVGGRYALQPERRREWEFALLF